MAYTATRAGPSTSAPSDGSRTIVLHDAQPRPEGDDDDSAANAHIVGTLRLRGASRRPRVAWAEEVVDNENMGKKSSKICCIYHKPRKFDESSSEEDSDSDDSGSDGGAKPPGYRRRQRHHQHGHDHDHAHNHDHGSAHEAGGAATRDASGASTVVHELEPEAEPNAYERGAAKKGKKKADR